MLGAELFGEDGLNAAAEYVLSQGQDSPKTRGALARLSARKVLATGGVYVTGGIAPRIVQRLTSGAFMDAFRAKGRLSEVVERMPVRVILTGDVALYGAAAVAARQFVIPSEGEGSRRHGEDPSLRSG